MDPDELLSQDTVLLDWHDKEFDGIDPCLQPAAKAFAANMDRIRTQLTYVPALVQVVTFEVQRLTTITNFAIAKGVAKDKLNDFARLIDAAYEKAEAKNVTDGIGREILVAAVKSSPVRDGLRANLVGASVASWTALECLAGDMWEAALNARPALMTRQVLDADGGQVAGITAKTVEMGLLQKHAFDLRGVMGTILRRKFDFSAIGALSTAYRAAFGDKVLTVFDQLPEVKILEAVRHVLVHRAGVFDQEYVEKWKRYTGAKSVMFSVGEQLSVTAQIVAMLYNIAATVGFTLIKDVDLCLKE